MFEYKDWVVEIDGKTVWIFHIEDLVLLNFGSLSEAFDYIDSHLETQRITEDLYLEMEVQKVIERMTNLTFITKSTKS